MKITLMCPGASSGQSAFPAELIEGIPVPERRYNIQDGRIVLSGYEDVILHHDADVLLSMSMFRLPTPQEQEQMAQAEQQSGIIQENTGQGMDSVSSVSEPEQGLVSENNTASTSDVPPALDNPDADSTAQSKKKASGG